MDWVTTSTILDGLNDFGDEAAWGRLTNEFRPLILAFAQRAGLGPAAAEDVTQETLAAFAVAYQQGKYDRERGRLGHWLYGIARVHVRRARKQVARSPAVGRGDSLWGALTDDLSEDATERAWTQAVIGACLERTAREFSAETFRAFEASMRGDRSAAEVATELGMDVKHVYNARHRVLGRIRELRTELDTP